MSQNNINNLLELWALSLMKHDDLGPFDSYKHIYNTIDATPLGDAPWKCFQAGFEEDLPDDAPSWKRRVYDIWYRDPDVVISNLLDNPDFDGEFDTMPYVHLDAESMRCWSDFMSANFPYCHCVSPIFVLELKFTQLIGPNFCRRSYYRRCYVCSRHPRERQDDCIDCNR